tara:strand:+ start:12539 stop:14464 length:1926 start_codon:yes stop_codon:yes gene_type:complete
LKDKYHILLGGIGDDSHSVGIQLLKVGLDEAGYQVSKLGIQNNIEDFFVSQNDFQIIFISNKNGHSTLYLQDYYKSIHEHIKNNPKQIWYIGGHLSVNESDQTIIKRFLEIGFTKVFPRFISMDLIIQNLKKDIAEKSINPFFKINKSDDFLIDSNVDNISDKRWSMEKVCNLRSSVLGSWKTGNEVNWEIVPSLHKNKKLNLDYIQKHRGEFPLLQPRTGVANLKNQINKLVNLQNVGNNVASVQLDASTRVKNYKKAEEGVYISNSQKESILNGFPLPIYGQKGVMDIVSSLKIPFQVRGGAPDHRLTYEIGISGGSSAVEGGFLCYLFPYNKDTSPSESLEYWQYIDRLVGNYYEKDKIIINREWFGVLTANLIPPSLAISVNIIQSILSAKQGVKSVSVGYAEQGNRSQDIAAIQSLRELNIKYLKHYGFTDINLTTVFHQYMAAFPTDTNKAEQLIFESAITAQLSRTDRMMMKSPVEAIKIPSTKENALGVKISKNGFVASKDLNYDMKDVLLEKKYIYMEVESIINAVIKLGDGDLAKGSIKAFALGVLDIPFSPSKYNKGDVLCLRDINGAIRYVHFGALPFNDLIKSFHINKIDKRKIIQRENSLYKMLEEDLQRIAMNDFKQWPLDNNYIL